MLKKLYVKNYAILEEIEVEFGPGLNILTGETGTGKSILIGALSLLFGERADSDFIRKGEEKALVEGYFDVKNSPVIKKCLEKEEIDYADELVMKREMSVAGRNRAFINDAVVSLNALKEISKHIVDIHGQHQHQSLFIEGSYLDVIDEYGGIIQLAGTVYDYFLMLTGTLARYKELCKKRKELQEQEEFYRFQLNEINKINPHPGEDAVLEKEIAILENQEKIREYAYLIYTYLYEGKGSASEKIKHAMKYIEELIDIDPELSGYKDDLEAAYAGVKETGNFIRKFGERIDYSPERLEELRERILALHSLTRKYKSTLGDVIEKKKELESKLNNVDSIDDEIREIAADIKTLTDNYKNACLKLSEQRKKTAQKLERDIEAYLNRLGMGKSLFRISVMRKEDVKGLIEIENKKYFANERGMDIVDFLIAPGAEENLKPVSKIASGGELSRIMLAIKSVLAEVDHIPVLIFDEIDSGISGRIASSVGRELRELSRYRQILCVTHLPQIAGMSHYHFTVEKQEQSGRVTTMVRVLNEKERKEEIAKLISGEKITEESLLTAEKLIEEGKI